jgi:hypothetical protein
MFGAEGGIRTPTFLRTPAPQAGASASSATFARRVGAFFRPGPNPYCNSTRAEPERAAVTPFTAEATAVTGRIACLALLIWSCHSEAAAQGFEAGAGIEWPERNSRRRVRDGQQPSRGILRTCRLRADPSGTGIPGRTDREPGRQPYLPRRIVGSRLAPASDLRRRPAAQLLGRVLVHHRSVHLSGPSLRRILRTTSASAASSSRLPARSCQQPD